MVMMMLKMIMMIDCFVVTVTYDSIQLSESTHLLVCELKIIQGHQWEIQQHFQMNLIIYLYLSSIKSSLKLLKFIYRFEFSIVICFIRKNMFYLIQFYFAEALLIKQSRVLSKIFKLAFSLIVSFTNLKTSLLLHLFFWRFSVSIIVCNIKQFHFFVID